MYVVVVVARAGGEAAAKLLFFGVAFRIGLNIHSDRDVPFKRRKGIIKILFFDQFKNLFVLGVGFIKGLQTRVGQ